MATSTNGVISFGVEIGEGSFPFGDYSIDKEWWYKQNHNGEEADYSTAYDYEKQNPAPVELVNTCSGSYPMYILAVPSTVKTAYRGEPDSFKPEDLKVTDEEKQALIDFIDKYL